MADLITLQDYKDAQGLSTPKEDLKINSIIPSVSQLIKTYCGNSFVDFYSSAKTETLNVEWATHVIQLTESPVNTITSVQERDSYSSAYTTLTTGAYEYYLSTNTDSIFRTKRHPCQYEYVCQNYLDHVVIAKHNIVLNVVCFV